MSSAVIAMTTQARVINPSSGTVGDGVGCKVGLYVTVGEFVGVDTLGVAEGVVVGVCVGVAVGLDVGVAGAVGVGVASAGIATLLE